MNWRSFAELSDPGRETPERPPARSTIDVRESVRQHCAACTKARFSAAVCATCVFGSYGFSAAAGARAGEK